MDNLGITWRGGGWGEGYPQADAGWGWLPRPQLESGNTGAHRAGATKSGHAQGANRGGSRATPMPSCRGLPLRDTAKKAGQGRARRRMEERVGGTEAWSNAATDGGGGAQQEGSGATAGPGGGGGPDRFERGRGPASARGAGVPARQEKARSDRGAAELRRVGRAGGAARRREPPAGRREAHGRRRSRAGGGRAPAGARRRAGRGEKKAPQRGGDRAAAHTPGNRARPRPPRVRERPAHRRIRAASESRTPERHTRELRRVAPISERSERQRIVSRACRDHLLNDYSMVDISAEKLRDCCYFSYGDVPSGPRARGRSGSGGMTGFGFSARSRS